MALRTTSALKTQFLTRFQTRHISSMGKYSITDKIPLPPTSHPIPRLGLGVYLAKGSKCTNAIAAALAAGYRHIDTAAYYGNEKETGAAVLSSNIPREEIFVTTKILRPVGGSENVDETYAAAKAGVQRTGLDYVDLFLIHTPDSGPKGRRTLWKALERLQKEGLTKTIGVSNYGVHHLQEMKEYANVYPPAVNQIEVCISLSPFPCLPRFLVRYYVQSNQRKIKASSMVSTARHRLILCLRIYSDRSLLSSCPTAKSI
jgi:diketogulonate reductase-like aldo/keto reductase